MDMLISNVKPVDGFNPNNLFWFYPNNLVDLIYSLHNQLLMHCPLVFVKANIANINQESRKSVNLIE